MWTETLALASASAEGGLSTIHIILGLIMIGVGAVLGSYLVSKIEKEAKHTVARIDAAVYVYVVSRNGEVDVTECAKTLKITKKQVTAAILRLKKAKRVAVEKGWGSG